MKLSESKLRTIIKKVLLEKRFSQLDGYEKEREMHIYYDLMNAANSDLRDEVFALIDQSYAYLGGNADIKSADDLADGEKNDYTNFLAWDIDDDPEPDVLRGMKPKAGKMKMTLSATDGSQKAANWGKQDTAERLSTPDCYGEMSGRAASAMMKKGIPVALEEETVTMLLPGKSIQWFGEHPYFSGDERFQDESSQIEAAKSKEYASRSQSGSYDGWYVRQLGGSAHAKMIFSACEIFPQTQPGDAASEV